MNDPLLAYLRVGLGGLGVTCLSRDPRFAGSNPAEDVNILSTSPPERLLAGGPESEISGSVHVLVISKFGGAQYILKGRSALGSNDLPINTIQYFSLTYLYTCLSS